MQVFSERAVRRTRHSPLTPDQVADAAQILERVERSRAEQLAALTTPVDAVARAHHASVRRILDAIRTARAQVAAGTYGTCADCRSALDSDCLMARPWSIWCASCAQR